MTDAQPARDELAELREYVSDLKANTEKSWNRPGSREAHEQEGAVRMAQRILNTIDGRIERARKNGRFSEGTGSTAPRNGGEPVAQHQD
jgi:hypothetical protein